MANNINRRPLGLIARQPLGWASRLTAGAALVVALLGIPEGLLALMSYLKPNDSSERKVIVSTEPSTNPHNLRLDVGELEVFYDRNQKSAELKLNFKATEFGDEDNELLPEEAWVKPLSPAGPAPIRLDNGIRFQDGKFAANNPVIPHQVPREMWCFITLNSPEHIRNFFRASGTRCLEVKLKDKTKKSHSMSFCFDLDDRALRGISNQKHIQFLPNRMSLN